MNDRQDRAMKGKKTLDIQTVSECNRCLGCRTLHPQASLINLEKPHVAQDAVKFEFYAILLIENGPGGCCCCGRRYYDYSYATMVFLTPGEIFRMSEENTLPEKGWLLTFHPDLLFRTSLKNHLGNYTFFFYRKEEALHLSQRETATATCCLQNLEEELRHPIDTHTNTLLSRHIELLLDYCTRFYERQFITREEKHKAILDKLENLAVACLETGRLQPGKLPSATYWAEELNLSEAYFNDLLKFETGKTFTEYFQFKRLEIAQRMLLQTDDTPAGIARRLGFPNVQYFSLIFKKVTGLAPCRYRYAKN